MLKKKSTLTTYSKTQNIVAHFWPVNNMRSLQEEFALFSGCACSLYDGLDLLC